jgi:hypothetical protein
MNYWTFSQQTNTMEGEATGIEMRLPQDHRFRCSAGQIR